MKSFFNRLGGKIVYWISQITHYTCRFDIQGQENFEELLKEGQAFLIACWHGHPMMVISFVLRYWDTSKFMIIVPEDWRIWANVRRLEPIRDQTVQEHWRAL